MPLFRSPRRGKSPPTSPEPVKRNFLSNSTARIRSRTKRRLFGGSEASSSAAAAAEPAGPILPTTTTYASPLRSTRSPVNNTCNNFLLGGTYYPGKDKKRRVFRKKEALWYRLFCSSPSRMVVSFILISYVMVWHLLVPFLQYLLSLGALLSSPNGNILRGLDLLSEDSLLHNLVDKLEQERQQAQSMAATRFAMQSQTRENRLELLKRMDPVFYHRNDPQEEKDTDLLRQEDNKKNNEKGRHLRTLDTMDDLLLEDQSTCPTDLKEDDIQTTLVLQTSVNRLWILHETCQRWKDPIVAVVAVHDRTTESAADLERKWKDHCPQLNLIVHALENHDPELYPVNELRNIGLDAVQTSHLLVVDVDFVPADNLDSIIKTTLQERIKLRQHKHEPISLNENEAIIVPAFERILSPPCVSDEECMQHLKGNSSFIPHDFTELLACHKVGDCIVFQSDDNPPGHSSTRSKEWLQEHWYDESKSVNLQDGAVLKSPRSVECFDSLRYEPYLVIRWCPPGKVNARPVAPYYDERFHGYGKNKIEYVQHLRIMGHRFVVLPEGFIVHNPHVESKVKERWNDLENSDLHGDMDKLYRKFLGELFDKYYGKVPMGIVEQCTK